ncbi:hypothetical protein EJB05_34171, partial [Eragrostis curvula]
MKPPAASPGRAEKPQLPAPAPPGLARLLLSKSRRGGRSRRAPATSPMFVSRGHRSRAADGEPSSPKVTCIGQVRMRKGKGKGKAKKKNSAAAAAPKASAPEKARGYCRCLKKAFLCGGLFDFDRRRRSTKAPSPEAERASRRSPWVFSSRDVAVAAAPKPVDARSARGEEEDDETAVGAGVFGSMMGRAEAEEKAQLGINSSVSGGGGEKEDEEEPEAQLVSSATTTPPKNALLLMRCRSAPQNRTSPLTSRFPAGIGAAPSTSPTRDAPPPSEIAAYLSPSPRKQADKFSPVPSPSPRKAAERFSPAPSPSPRKSEMELLVDEDGEQQRHGPFFAVHERAEEAVTREEEEEEADEDSEEDEMRCSSARPLVLQRCKSEPATNAAAKMAAGPAADATTAGCFWANGGSSGRRKHAPPPAAPAAVSPVALTGH